MIAQETTCEDMKYILLKRKLVATGFLGANETLSHYNIDELNEGIEEFKKNYTHIIELTFSIDDDKIDGICALFLPYLIFDMEDPLTVRFNISKAKADWQLFDRNSVPLSLNRLKKRGVNEFYSNRVYFHLITIVQTTDKFEKILQELEKAIPSKIGLLTQIKKLRQELEIHKKNFLEHYVTIKSAYDYIKECQRMLNWTPSPVKFTYFDYGLTDLFYDNIAGETLTKTLYHPYVLAALDNSDWMPSCGRIASMADFVNGLNCIKAEIVPLIAADSAIFELTKVSEIAQSIKMIMENTFCMRKVLSDEINRITQDKDNKNIYLIKYKQTIFTRGLEAIKKGCQELNKLYYLLDNLDKRWTIMSDSIENNIEVQKKIESTEIMLKDKFIELGNAILVDKKNQHIMMFKDLSNADKNHIYVKAQYLIKKLILSLLQERLTKQETINSINQLTKKIEELEINILKKIPNIKTGIVLYRDYDLLEKFIDAIRIERHLLKLEQVEEEKSIKIIFSLPQDISPNQGHYAFALINEDDSAKIVGITQDNRISGMDSPLTKLCAGLSSHEIRVGQISKILLLSAVPPYDKLSQYELGVLSIKNISTEKVICYDTYKKINDEKIDAASSPIIPFEWLPTKASNDHILPFLKMPQHSNASEIQFFSPSIEGLYMKLTMCLVYFLREKNYRDRLAIPIPDGKPTACLIISETGEILSWAINTTSIDLTQHAEMNALHVYFMQNTEQRYLPAGSRLFTSLKSCNMCSGGIMDCIDPSHSIDKKTKIIYGQVDPGQINTVLKGEKIERASTIKIKGDFIFDKINYTYQKEKKKGSKINAAECFKFPSQYEEELKNIHTYFIEQMTLPSEELATAQAHIRSFLTGHNLNFLIHENFQIPLDHDATGREPHKKFPNDSNLSLKNSTSGFPNYQNNIDSKNIQKLSITHPALQFASPLNTGFKRKEMSFQNNSNAENSQNKGPLLNKSRNKIMDALKRYNMLDYTAANCAIGFIEAATNGNLADLQLFLEHTKKINFANSFDGNTALHVAASNSHLDCVRWLLEKGAVNTICNNEGLKPENLAVDERIKQLLCSSLQRNELVPK